MNMDLCKSQQENVIIYNCVKSPNEHPLQKEHAAVAAYLSHDQLDVDGLITIFIGTQDQCDRVYQSIINAIRDGKSFISIQDYH